MYFVLYIEPAYYDHLWAGREWPSYCTAHKGIRVNWKAITHAIISLAGDDFIPAIFEVTLPESMCVQITTLPDSLALEIGEVFQVSFAIAGLTNDDGSLTTSDGRAMVVPGIQVATVVIIDEDG